MNTFDELLMLGTPLPELQRHGEEEYLREQSKLLSKLIVYTTWSYVIFSFLVLCFPWASLRKESFAAQIAVGGIIFIAGISLISYWLYAALKPFLLSRLTLDHLCELGTAQSKIDAWSKSLLPWYLVSHLVVSIVYVGIVSAGVFLTGNMEIHSLGASMLFNFVTLSCCSLLIWKVKSIKMGNK